jgi:hypothetical protein
MSSCPVDDHVVTLEEQIEELFDLRPCRWRQEFSSTEPEQIIASQPHLSVGMHHLSAALWIGDTIDLHVMVFANI